MMGKILVIAAHPDDEVLGTGGLIAKHTSRGDEVHVMIVTEGCSSQYPDRPEMIPQKQQEAREAAGILGVAPENLHFGNMPDMKLDTVPLTAINACIERIVRSVHPKVVYTHAGTDVNLDHRRIFEATLVACRPYSAPYLQAVYAYFVPSSSEWGAAPFDANHYVDISDVMEAKSNAMGAYKSELRSAPHPRSRESLRAINASFGSVIGCRYAEAFKLVRSIERV